MLLAAGAALFLFVLSIRRDIQASGRSLGEIAVQSMAEEWSGAVCRNFMPLVCVAQSREGGVLHLTESQVTDILPLYGYSAALSLRGSSVDNREQEEPFYEISDGKGNAEGAAGEKSMEELVREENEKTGAERENDPVKDGKAGETLQDLLRAENDAVLQMAERETAFVPHTKQVEVNLEELDSYETLVKNFYTVDGNTMVGSDQLNVRALTEKNLTISKEGEEPQILIYHTHSQECFSDSVPQDASTSIVGVGEYLSEILRTQYGYKVLHHTGEYDVVARDDAYSKALPCVEQVLAENPSIQVVIDLHRDEMAKETRLVTDLDGRPTARFMFFNGLSRTKKTGNIAYLYNENQADNLAFSFQMQLKATEYYPGLVRKIYLKGYRYNMHLRPRTLLVELGAQNNTLEEAMNACDPLAHILDMVLSGNG